MKRFLKWGWPVMLAVAVAIALAAPQGQAQNMPKVKEFRIERAIAPQAVACIECHKRESPAIFTDWAVAGQLLFQLLCHTGSVSVHWW